MPRLKESRNPFGSIFRREIVKNGKRITVFDARKRYTLADGKVRDKTRRCRSHAEAVIALGNLTSEIERAKTEAAEKEEHHSFFDLCDYFQTEYIKPAQFADGRQIAGYRSDTKLLEGYIADYKSFFGNVRLKDLSYELLRAFSLNVATSPVKFPNATRKPRVSTVNRKLSFLRRILNVGIQLQWMTANPFRHGAPLIRASAENVRNRILTFDEEERLLAQCYGKAEHLRPILILAVDTGLRRGEIFSLLRGQIDLERKIITVSAQNTKTQKMRVVPVSKRLEQELTGMFEAERFAPEDLIFGGMKSCKHSFETACRNAGITGLTFHDLRHSAISWMDAAGVSDAVKMNIAGHTQARTHQRYNNLSEDILRQAREKMDEFRRKMAA
jgi:integrase